MYKILAFTDNFNIGNNEKSPKLERPILYNGRFYVPITNYGIYTWSNGDMYNGTFRNGLMDGSGTLMYKHNCKYVGKWQKGKRHGLGIETLHDSISGKKVVYDGVWSDNKMHGSGTWICYGSDGKKELEKYDGLWKNGKRNGFGIETLHDSIGGKKVVYAGEWRNNKIYGSGKWTLYGSDENLILEFHGDI